MVAERRGSVVTVAINRPEVRNAVNQETARRLLEELEAFDGDPDLNVAVLHGEGEGEGMDGCKCASSYKQIFTDMLQSVECSSSSSIYPFEHFTFTAAWNLLEYHDTLKNR